MPTLGASARPPMRPTTAAGQFVLDLRVTPSPAGASARLATLGAQAARRELAAYEAYAAPEPTIGSLQAYWAVVERFGLAGDKPTALHLEALANLFGDRTVCAEELAPLIGQPKARLRRIAELISSASGYSRRPPTVVRNGSTPCPPARVRALLQSELQSLPETMLDPDEGDLREPLDIATVERAGALAPALAQAAIVEALLSRRADPGTPTVPLIADWEALQELFEEIGSLWPTAAALGEGLARYAKRELCPDHPAGRRRRVLGRLLAAWNKVQIYEADFPEAGAAVALIMPPEPVLGAAARQAITRFRTQHTLEGRRSRKNAARAITRMLDAALACAKAGVQQVREMAEACRDVERLMRLSAVVGPLEFGYDGPVVGGEGLPGSGEQTVVLRAHWRREFEAELGQGLPQPGLMLWTGADEIPVSFDPLHEPLIFEYLRTEAQGALPVEPRFVRYSRAGVLLPADGLDAVTLQRRHDEMLADGLPFPRYRPAGLMAPGDRDMVALHQRALAAGRVLVDPEPYLHGLQMAFACALVMVTGFARSGEARQIVREERGWTVVGQGSRAADAFMAVPKGQRRLCAFPIAPMAFEALADLVETTLRREALEELPVVEPSATLRRRVGPGRFVFACRGRMLDVGDLNFLLAFLFAGVARVRTHDLRHAAATRAVREGASQADVARWMNVAGWCVPHYANDPDDEAADDEDDDGEAGSLTRQIEWLRGRGDVQRILGSWRMAA